MWNDRRWLNLVLGVSLLVNLFLIGVMTGHVLAERPSAGKAAPRIGGLIHPNTLIPEDKKGFSAVMHRHRAVIEDRRRAFKAAKATLEATIVNPVYDRTKVDAAFTTMRQASEAIQEANQQALAEAVGTLGPDARAALIRPIEPQPR